MTEDQEGPKKVELPETGEIELPRIDVTSFIGKKAKVKDVEEFEGKFGYFVKIETESLGTLVDETGKEIKDKDNNPKPAIASRIFSLKEDATGKLGWTKESDLGQFLAKHGCKHYNDLVGKEVIVQGRDSKGVTFLTVM